MKTADRDQLRTPAPVTAVAVWHGLSENEARRRLALSGPNELPRPPKRGPWRVLLGILQEPMFLLLALAAAIYLTVGSLHEGLLLSGFAVLSIGLVLVQELRSEHALEALRALGAPQARVLREGVVKRIRAREVVPGDLLMVGEGERIAADALLHRAENLRVDESLLTGESIPVGKSVVGVDGAAPLTPDGENRAWVYAGTLVVSGHGVAEVCATGIATQAGRIGLSLASIETESTLLQHAIARLVRVFGLFALAVSASVVLLYGIAHHDWLQGALAGIAIAMAMLPEEFPMALAVFLALGAWRLAQIKVLARRPAVIETLGAASVLCVDKTGTLTENRMRLHSLQIGVQHVAIEGGKPELNEPFHHLLEYARLASKRQTIDPMEAALFEPDVRRRIDAGHAHDVWPLEREYGLSQALPAMSRVWRRTDGSRVVAAKGAPEAIAQLCRLDTSARAQLLADVESLASQGLRVLAVAAGDVDGSADALLPENPADLDLHLLGLLAFRDPPRASAAAAVAQARRAGIAVVMITGDFPATARAIAEQVGIDTAAPVISGSMIDAMDDAALTEAGRRSRVFARVRPEQKLRLVEAFKADGHVVAMTGDGVNDAPALKAAHIGLAMGTRGTDVAREAAGIVLLDDDFSHLVAGVRMGRRIFANLRRVLIYIAAIHVPIAGLALVPVLLGLPPLLLPMHVVLIEMVIDPICSVAFENQPEDADLMDRPPRPRGEALIAGTQLRLGLLVGAFLLLACLVVYGLSLQLALAIDSARTLALVALTAGNLMLVRVIGSRAATLPTLLEAGHFSWWLIAVLGGGIVAACITVPALTSVFHFDSVSTPHLLSAAMLGVGAVLSFDLLKRRPGVRRTLGRS